MKEKIEEVKNDNSFSLNFTGILDILICLLLFISSIYKGAFYKSDFLFPNLAISIIGVVYLLHKVIKEIVRKDKDKKTKSKITLAMDVLMLAISFTYFMPIVFKTYVSLPDSIYEMLRYVNMTIIYFIARSSKNSKIYLNIFVLIALGQMILGIDQLTTRTFQKFLNEISTGYLQDTDRLSATIQYANITGTVITLGALICFNNISKALKKEGKIKYVELLFNIFILLLAVSSVVLTKSRVAIIVIFGSHIIYTILSHFCISKKGTIFKFFLIVYSFVISGIVEKLVINKNKLGVYISIALASLVYLLLYTLVKRIYSVVRKKVEESEKLRDKKKYINITIVLFVIVILITIVALPKNIVIENSKSAKSACLNKNIYDFKTGENNLEFKVKSLKEDTRFNIKLKGITEGYQEVSLGEYAYYDNTSWNFKDTLNVPDNIRRIVLSITVQRGKIEISEFKMNNKNMRLSYMFIPDGALNKIKDTASGVYGDSLRLEYAKDSFKLLKNSPIIGVGGEGFKYTYATVQEKSYISSEAHSAILQSLVEVGIVGTAVLIGIITISLVIIFKLVIRLNKMDEENKYKAIVIMIMYLCNLSTVIFDLAFSYALMIYVFSVITALLSKTYIDAVLKDYSDNKSVIDWSYVKIITLSLSLVTLAYATYFSLNAYRASIIKVPNQGDEISATEVAENIAYLELKNKYDKFDIDYMRELNEEYTKYKSMLTDAIINASGNKSLRNELEDEQNKLIKSIKENADRMLEYSYYDKYILKEVADVYIENYITFENIYKEQFSNSEVAYAFYLNYALKLTDRIIELNPKSKKANEMYDKMCREYIESLKKDNMYLNSNAVQNILMEFYKRVN